MKADAFDPEAFTQRIRAPTPCADDGMIYGGSYPQPAWTPRGFAIRGERFILACACGHRADAPLQKLVAAGKGDLPWPAFSGKWRCECCGSRTITVEIG